MVRRLTGVEGEGGEAVLAPGGGGERDVVLAAGGTPGRLM